MNLTDIQENFRELVLELFKTTGTKHAESIQGNNEKYFLVKTGSIEVYLYEDGEANIKSPKKDLRYELADYKNHDDLKTQVLKDLRHLLEKNER